MPNEVAEVAISAQASDWPGGRGRGKERQVITLYLLSQVSLSLCTMGKAFGLVLWNEIFFIARKAAQ